LRRKRQRTLLHRLPPLLLRKLLPMRKPLRLPAVR